MALPPEWFLKQQGICTCTDDEIRDAGGGHKPTCGQYTEPESIELHGIRFTADEIEFVRLTRGGGLIQIHRRDPEPEHDEEAAPEAPEGVRAMGFHAAALGNHELGDHEPDAGIVHGDDDDL